MNDFSNCKFKALVFQKISNEKIINLFKLTNIEIVMISDVYQLFGYLEMYLSNNDRNELDTKILTILRGYATDIFCIGLGLNRKNITIKEFEMSNLSYFSKFFDNLEYLGFSEEDIQQYGKKYHEIYFKKACDIYGVDIGFDMNETVSKAYVYWNLKIGFANHEFFKESLEFARKFARLQQNG